MPRYKAIGQVPVPLESGRVLAPGEQVSKDDLSSEDQARIDSGQLVELPSTRSRPKKEDS